MLFFLTEAIIYELAYSSWKNGPKCQLSSQNGLLVFNFKIRGPLYDKNVQDKNTPFEESNIWSTFEAF